jgi:hypothetical protein
VFLYSIVFFFVSLPAATYSRAHGVNQPIALKCHTKHSLSIAGTIGREPSRNIEV